jgi:putative chitinase
MPGKWTQWVKAGAATVTAAGALAIGRKLIAKARGLTAEMLQAIMPDAPPAKVREYLPLVRAAMAEANITTPLRQAGFLAQLGHESDQFRSLNEYGDGLRYEGSKVLGNTVPGDGPRFKGRGPIQLTGRDNYTRAGKALKLDLVNHPELAAEPGNGFRIAAWYWADRGLNSAADAQDLEGMTRKIQGALGGLPARAQLYARALQVLL